MAMIDRQAAIDALDDIESEVADGDGFQYEKWRKYFCELPSAQPETNCSEFPNNSDTISRQAAISLPVKPKEDRYFQTQNLDDAYDYGWYSLQKCIEKLPSAPKRKTGKWIYITDGHYEYFKCDQCEKHSGEPTPFCRYCGADMREGQDAIN